MSTSAIQIGATREAVEAAREAVIAILTAGQGGKTTRKALATFAAICEVRNVTVQGGTFTINAAGEESAGIHVESDRVSA